MSDRYSEQLSAYLDGELARAEAEALERHLGTCKSCRTELAGLRRIVARLDSAPSAGPTRDLWPDLQRRIDAVSAPPDPRRRRWLLAAAAFVAMVLASIAWVTLGPGSLPDGARRSRADARVPEELVPYREAVARWRDVVDVRELPEPLASSLESDLAAYDTAVRDGLDALGRRPGDPELTSHLIRTLQAQARLLERAREAREML